MVSKKKAFFLDLISIVDVYTYTANDDAKNGKLEVSGPKWGLSTFQSLFKVNTWLKNEAGNCFVIILPYKQNIHIKFKKRWGKGAQGSQ